MYKKQKSISEYNPNEPFSDIFVVRFTKEIRSTKNGKYFFEIKIQDSNGDGMLKYWGSNNLQNVEKLYDLIKEDSVIFAEGSVTEYNGNIDFSVNEGKIKVLKIGEYNPSDFIKVSKRDKEEMFTELKAHMDSIINPELKQVLNVFFF